VKPTYLIGGGVAALLVAFAIWSALRPGTPEPPAIAATRSEQPSGPAVADSEPATRPLGGATLPAVRGLEPAGDASAAADAPDLAPRGALDPALAVPSPQREVRLPRDRVLARVNGAPIRVGDLVSQGSGPGDDVTMNGEEYGARLVEAIDAALVTQAAAADGVVLSEVQARRLTDIEVSRAAAAADARDRGLSFNSYGPAQVAFEVRRSRTLLLQEELVRRAGGPPSSEGDAYTDAVRALVARLRGQGKVEQLPL
jgi:hypothetical protein